MNFVLVLILMVSLVGCAKNKGAATTDKQDKKAAKSGKKTPAAVAESTPTKTSEERKAPVITPSTESSGRVSMVNQSARFVVLTYAEGNLPAVDRRLSLYRNGLKVAEVKVTGPQRDNNTVADIVAGDAALNDEVRE